MHRIVPEDSRRAATRTFGRGLILLVSILAVLWLLEIVDVVLGGALDGWGIRPRTWVGLGNILTAPWVHVGFGHLIANTIPFMVLGFLVILRGVRVFVVTVLVAALISGLGIWLFGGAADLTFGRERCHFWPVGLSVGARLF